MQTLGKCWIAYGVLRIVIGVALIVWEPTATVMFGALLVRVAEPFTLMNTFHVLYAGTIILSFVCGVLGIVGGLALSSGRRSGRTLLVIASALSASNLPIGIALSIFTLVWLLPADAPRTVKQN